MATKKQRKREMKERRHEWEYVYVDDEGHEVAVEEDETPGSDAPRATKATTSAKPGAKTPAKGRGAARKVDPPSWQRVLKRAAIFAPIMFLVISLLSKDLTLQQKVVQTVFLLAFFVPFSYLMDMLMYRAYQRRVSNAGKPPDKKR